MAAAISWRRHKAVDHQPGEKVIDAESSPEVLQLIQANFPVHPVPTVPEIRLHKAGPKSGLWRFAERDREFGTPYWAHLWGGGLALARHVLDHPETVVGRRVLDLGSGSGIVAIAAAKAGAQAVIAADTDPYAIAAIRLNAAANCVTVPPFLGDLAAGSPPEVDIVLVGDLFYESILADRVTTFLDQCLGSNVKVLIGDPWRAFLPRTRLQLLAEYPGPDFSEITRPGQQKNAVFSFEPSRKRRRQSGRNPLWMRFHRLRSLKTNCISFKANRLNDGPWRWQKPARARLFGLCRWHPNPQRLRRTSHAFDREQFKNQVSPARRGIPRLR